MIYVGHSQLNKQAAAAAGRRNYEGQHSIQIKSGSYIGQINVLGSESVRIPRSSVRK